MGWWRSVDMYTSLTLRLCVCRATEIMVGWGGVGWGWDDDVPCTCTHVWCYVCVSVVLRRSWSGGVGWGGDGMMTFRVHVHMFDATSVCLSRYGDHGGVGMGWWRSVHMYTCLILCLCACRATEIMVGWGGAGMGWRRSVHMYTCLMLRLCVFRATEIMVGWGGVGSMTFLAHVHIFDATSVCLSCYGDHGGVGWGGLLHCTESLA